MEISPELIDKVANLEVIAAQVQADKEASVLARQEAAAERQAAEMRIAELQALEPVILERYARLQEDERKFEQEMQEERENLEQHRKNVEKEAQSTIDQAEKLRDVILGQQAHMTAELERVALTDKSLNERDQALMAREQALAGQLSQVASLAEVARAERSEADSRITKAEKAEAALASKIEKLEKQKVEQDSYAKDLKAKDKYLSLWENTLDKRERAYEGMARSTNTQTVLNQIKTALEKK